MVVPAIHPNSERERYRQDLNLAAKNKAQLIFGWRGFIQKNILAVPV
jgi:hypothetical protein